MFLIRPYELTYYQADAEDPWHYIWIGFDGKKSLSCWKPPAFRGDTCVFSFPRAAALFEEIRAVPDKTPFTETALCAQALPAFYPSFPGRRKGGGEKEGEIMSAVRWISFRPIFPSRPDRGYRPDAGD